MYVPVPKNFNSDQSVSMTEYSLQNLPLLFFRLSDRNLKATAVICFLAYNLSFGSL